jgi:hypothetical protein
MVSGCAIQAVTRLLRDAAGGQRFMTRLYHKYFRVRPHGHRLFAGTASALGIDLKPTVFTAMMR